MKTFLTSLGIILAFTLFALSGSILSAPRPTYNELVWQNALLAEQVRAKQIELEDLKQDIKDGYAPCKGGTR
jgi:hypothetical protein